MTKYTTRYATYDEPEREDVVRLYIENLWPISHLEPDMLTVIKSIYQSIYQFRQIVIERNGEIVGCTSFVDGTYWYSPQKCLFDTGFFIVPKARKTRAAKILLDALRAEAERRGAILIMGAGTKDKSVAPILAKRYPQIGAAFMVAP